VGETISHSIRNVRLPGAPVDMIILTVGLELTIEIDSDLQKNHF